MTRQRRWQIKMTREGKCKICGAPAVTKFHCEKHRRAVNTRAFEAAHKRDSAKRRYAGAEYAGGHYAATVFHFPKWLLAEPLFCIITRRPGPSLAGYLMTRTHPSVLENPSHWRQSARCARQGR
jgi:hypothetical protein